MTQLRRAVRREVSGVLREDLIVTLYPGGVVGIRAKRTRREYQLPLATIYHLAIDAELDRTRQEKALARRAGKPARVSRSLLHRG